MPQHRHGPIEAAVVVDAQSQTLRMLPGTPLQPGYIDRIVGMAQLVDMLGLHLQVDGKRVRLIPAHSLQASLAVCDDL